MNLKFKFIDDKNIKIIAEKDGMEQEVGCIFTPSSSGQNITNAIQICGISEAFDFWGCSRYVQPKDLDVKKRVMTAIEDKEEKFIQTKDIQLMFNFETRPTFKINTNQFDNCLKCFNKPCSCENTPEIFDNPYIVKREETIDKQLEYLDDGKIHLKGDERKELIKKLIERGKGGKNGNN